MKHILLSLVLLLSIFSCKESEDSVDMVLYNAKAYTVDEKNPWVEAIAIKGDRIHRLGSNEEMSALAAASTKMIDCQNQFLMPGFIEGHGHFAGMGEMLINLNLLNSSSWEEIVAMVKEKAATAAPGEWIEGRGWHQEKWDSISIKNVNGYPYHHALSSVAPDNPVILYHASGHSLFANEKAMQAAKISLDTEAPMGGEIVRDEQGQAIGVFEERAMKLVQRAFQKYEAELGDELLEKKWYTGIEMAQQECLSKGITSFQDAGSSFEEIARYQKLAEDDKLSLRLWAMIRTSAERMDGNLKNIRQVGTGNHFFTCRAIKSELDGALGSFGAWLLESYTDKNNFIGQNTTEIEELESIAALAQENDMQLCIHAIGDRANRESLDVIEKFNPTNKNHRWRIEHSQHISTQDIPRFKSTGAIASMQGIHCTSDAPFVERRLGNKRSKEGAYPWRSLIDAGAIINNGTDAPVEDVDPIPCFYASVTRKRIDNGFEFFTEQAMTREEAIRSYTINNAYAAFEEELKGSLEIGKLADLVLLSQNLIECTDDEILKTEIVKTIVGGKIKFEK